MRHFLTPDGAKYVELSSGVIHQLDAEPIEYDEAYLKQHVDKPNYEQNSLMLNGIRLGLVVGTWGMVPESIVDVGYGDGSFLKFCVEAGIGRCMGLDKWAAPLPIGAEFAAGWESAEVYTFWDTLEHMPELGFLKNLPAELVVISVPDCGGKDFNNWKHRRPGEHLWHFDRTSLQKLMFDMEWRSVVNISHVEDTVRGGPNNILTGAFCR